MHVIFCLAEICAFGAELLVAFCHDDGNWVCTILLVCLAEVVARFVAVTGLLVVVVVVIIDLCCVAVKPILGLVSSVFVPGPRPTIGCC